MFTLSLLSLLVMFTQADLPANRKFKPEVFNEKFECFFDMNNVYKDDFNYGNDADREICCGKMANGLKQCDQAKEWRKIGDSDFVLCKNNFATALAEGKDLCCDSNQINNCDICKSFMVWPYYGWKQNEANGLNSTNQDNKGMRDVILTDTNWREKFEGQEMPDGPDSAYYNTFHPFGFVNARLAEFNAPPVCVFVPSAGGRVIEIRVESDNPGNKLCVDDIQDDSLANKNNPGITQSCDDSQLKTCFPDGNVGTGSGFPFVITCQDSCEASDVDLWLRVRASEKTWTEGSENAETNVEMWCQWGISGEEFSVWDQYPSDLTPPKDPRIFLEEASVSGISALLSVLIALAMY